MTASAKRLPGRTLLTALGVAVTVGFLVFAVVNLDWKRVTEALARSHLFPWVPAGVACYLAGHLLRGVRCRLLLLRHDHALSLATATNFVVIGYAVNNILPARAGELARAAMITERTGIPFAEALTVTFVERLLDGLTIVGIFYVGAHLSGLPAGWIRSSLWIVVALFSAAALGIVALAVFPDVFRTVAARLSARLGPKLQGRIVRLVAQVTGGVSALGQPRNALRIVGLSVAIWLLEAGMFLALLPAQNFALHPASAAVTMAVTNLGLLVPSTPGFIGPFHFFCMQSMVALGGEEAAAFAYAVLVHATFYVPITAWGVVALLTYGVEFAALRTLTRAASRASQPPGAALASVLAASAPGALVETLPAVAAIVRTRPRLLTAVVRAFLFSTGPAFARLDPTARETVTEEVATFVDGQIRALPNRLRVLFGIGLWGFAFCVRVRHPRGFCAQGPERQVAIVESWAFGRLAEARKLFRLIRSTALLCFYDLPVVRAAAGEGEAVVPLRRQTSTSGLS